MGTCLALQSTEWRNQWQYTLANIHYARILWHAFSTEGSRFGLCRPEMARFSVTSSFPYCQRHFDCECFELTPSMPGMFGICGTLQDALPGSQRSNCCGHISGPLTPGAHAALLGIPLELGLSSASLTCVPVEYLNACCKPLICSQTA